MGRDLASLFLAASLAAAGCSGSPESEELRWHNGTVELVGRLTLPDGEGPYPAAVFLHGVGEGTRDDAIYRVHAERLARAGIALLTYDKRGCGESGGVLLDATFHDRAGDALAGVARLRADPRIRSDAIGLFGSSQGASVALLAASRDPDLAFVATLSPSPHAPAEQERVWVEERLRRAGFDGEAVRGAAALVDDLAALVSAGAPPEDLRRRLDAEEGAAWFEAAAIRVPDPEEARRLRDLPHDFQPLDALRELRVPVFVAQGAEDGLVPGPRAAEVFRALERPAGAELTVELFAGAGHVVRDGEGAWPETYWASLLAWLRSVLGD